MNFRTGPIFALLVAAVSVGVNGQSHSQIVINGLEINREQLTAIVRTYHYAPPPGRYWYDSRSGAWGLAGHETAGFILPGYSFGPMSPNASRGNTGVFINGREINRTEATRIQQAFGAVDQGRWWLDGQTGYFGLEGNPVPLGNLISAMRSRTSGRPGDNVWCSRTACGNDDGKSGYINLGNGNIVGYDH